VSISGVCLAALVDPACAGWEFKLTFLLPVVCAAAPDTDRSCMHPWVTRLACPHRLLRQAWAGCYYLTGCECSQQRLLMDARMQGQWQDLGRTEWLRLPSCCIAHLCSCCVDRICRFASCCWVQ
jgi:hypothetical protein